MVDVISLGAGVQSSTLLLMADRGQIKMNGETIIPKYAIMSDTGNEPKAVYTWLEFLKKQTKNIEIVVTDNGHIIEDTLEGIEKNQRFSSIPFHTKSKEGKRGMMWRQCTRDYKIFAVRQKIRQLLGYPVKGKVKDDVRLWMGISTDEIERVKTSAVGYIENVYPLIDYEMSRQDCLDWFKEEGMPLPPRSSCIVCPYHSHEYWQRMKKEDPESFQMAVEFDRKIRRIPKVDGDVYLHRSRMPLEEAVQDQPEYEQLDLVDYFQNECEGMCGL